ncbi:MAG: hypothetical protein AB7G23_02970 [Vicinamibacterales bacterium]
MPGRRTDTTHAPIRDALRRTGWQVEDTSRIGNGFPDLMAKRAGVGVLVEVKDADGTLTPAEVEMHAWLRACGATVVVVRSVDEALALRPDTRALQAFGRGTIFNPAPLGTSHD